MTSAPPPPPPGGGGQNPPPAPPPPGGNGGQPPAQPPYGSAPPPQAPHGGPPGGQSNNNGKIMGIISTVVGVLGLCCCTWFIFSIGAIVLGYFGKRESEKVNDSTGRILSIIGIVAGIVGIVAGIIYWILLATGVIDLDNWYEFSTS